MSTNRTDDLGALREQQWNSDSHRDALEARLATPARRRVSARAGLIGALAIGAIASAAYVAYTRTATVSFDGDTFTITEDGRTISGTTVTNPDGSKTVTGDGFQATVAPVGSDGQRNVSVQMGGGENDALPKITTGDGTTLTPGDFQTITTKDGKVIKRYVKRADAPK